MITLGPGPIENPNLDRNCLTLVSDSVPERFFVKDNFEKKLADTNKSTDSYPACKLKKTANNKKA